LKIWSQDQKTLFKAAADLRYLLAQGYPRRGALLFVGNHYQLTRREREMLNRGVYPEPEAQTRRQRLLPAEKIQGRALGVDGHNVLITLECALLKQVLIDCDDGLIRDVAGASSSYRPGEITDRALELALNFLQAHGAKSVLFLLDAPMSQSGELAAHVSAVLAGRGLMGRARAVPVPEAELYAFTGLVATSDSVLIDRVDEPVDLAGQIIRRWLPEVEIMELKEPALSARTRTQADSARRT